jgi:hypothetical protein
VFSRSVCRPPAPRSVVTRRIDTTRDDSCWVADHHRISKKILDHVFSLPAYMQCVNSGKIGNYPLVVRWPVAELMR